MTLTQLFTNIATAIRAKKGSTALIQAEDFPSEISSISTGHLTNAEYTEANDDLDDILENTVPPAGTISITENGIVDVTNYVQANVNVQAPSKLTIDESAGYYQNNRVMSFITEVNDIDLTKNQNTTSFGNLFYGCTNLTKVTNFNTTGVTFMYAFFRDCNNLVDVPVFDTSSNTEFNNMFKNCNSLSNESLNNILQMCINATSFTGTKTLYNLGLSSTQATTCQSLSNWNAFVSAGWISGY